MGYFFPRQRGISGGLPGLSGATEDVVGNVTWVTLGFSRLIFVPAGATRPLTAADRRRPPQTEEEERGGGGKKP